MNDNEKEKKPVSDEALEFDAPKETDTVNQLPTSGMQEHEDDTTTPAPSLQLKKSRWQRLKEWVRTHKRRTAAIVVAVLLIPVAVVALTDLRFAVMNLFSQATVTVVVLDDTARPIPAAEVEIDGAKATTNGKGQAKLEGKLYGAQTVKIFKEGYRPVSEALKVTQSPLEKKYSLVTTGIRFHATVLDILSGKPLKGVKVSYQKSDAVSNEKGQVTLVVPPGVDKVSATASLEGYNETSVELGKDKTTSLTLTPAGKIYFLSKRSGKIDVMSANLDGTDQRVVLAGTGREHDTSTSLLATRDWKYLALKARRDTAEKIYLISTASNNTLSTVDTSANANFSLHGWSGTTLIYTASNLKGQYNTPGDTALKGFNASTGRTFTFDETQTEGAFVRQPTSPQIVAGDIIYARLWSPSDAAHNNEVVVSNMSGQKKVVQSRSSTEVYDYQFVSYNAHEVYFSEFGISASAFYEYEDGKVTKVAGKTGQAIYEPYPDYLLSPAGDREVVEEQRDGKHVISIRPAGSEETGKVVLSMTEYQIYGWYGNYLLVSKNGSELYALDPETTTSPKEPVKIGTYHKPQITYRGYGYGYGGL